MKRSCWPPGGVQIGECSVCGAQSAINDRGKCVDVAYCDENRRKRYPMNTKTLTDAEAAHLTIRRLEQVSMRAEGATPPPWSTDRKTMCAWFDQLPDGSITIESKAQLFDIGVPVAACPLDGGTADAHFIANARADVPALVHTIKTLLPFVEAVAKQWCPAVTADVIHGKPCGKCLTCQAKEVLGR